MRLHALVIVGLLLAACGGNPDAGCDRAKPIACTCPDGRAGEKACGTAECDCPSGRCELVHAEAVDFGAVPPGVGGERELVLENRGDAGCDITGLRLEGCGGAFTVGGMPGTVGIPPGLRWPIVVGFRPTEEGEQACALAFDVDDPVLPLRTVVLRGRGEPGCLAVEPRELRFGPVAIGCGTGAAPVAVTNGCDVPVVLDEITLAGAPPFALADSPLLPLGLAAPGEASFEITYRPLEVGSHTGTLRLGFEGLDPVTIALSGLAEEAPWITDTFAIPPRPQIDILFVIDNGTGMAEHESGVLANLQTFLSFLQAHDLDFHVGVTTTGLEPGGDCPGGVGGGEDGRLFPVLGETVRFLTNETPDLESQWRANVSVGACRTGPNQVFEAAVRALTPPVVDAADDPRHDEPADGNAGFYRPDARLSVIAITDRDDDSPETPARYWSVLQGLKGYRNTHLFDFSAITGDPGTGCGSAGHGDASPGDRLVDLVGRTDGGMFSSICEPDWIEVWSWGRAFNWPRNCHYLSATPLDANGNGEILDTEGELEVRVNGALVASRDEEGQVYWEYDHLQQAVCFRPLALPEPGSAIEIGYRVGCP